MMWRRVTACLLAVFMLHLSFLGADLACSQHGDESALTTGEAASPHASSAHATHVASASVADSPSSAHAAHGLTKAVATVASISDTSNQPPCEIPEQANCCQAFMGCSLVFSPNGESVVAASVAPPEWALAPAAHEPLSAIASPEPPPPRA